MIVSKLRRQLMRCSSSTLGISSRRVFLTNWEQLHAGKKHRSRAPSRPTEFGKPMRPTVQPGLEVESSGHEPDHSVASQLAAALTASWREKRTVPEATTRVTV